MIDLSGYRPHLRGLDNLCTQQEAVVLVVVGELLAHNGVKVMQTVAVGLETDIATVGTY